MIRCAAVVCSVCSPKRVVRDERGNDGDDEGKREMVGDHGVRGERICLSL